MKIEAAARLRLTAETYGDYVTRLINDLNIKQIGEGSYARVFQHPTMKNIAVKLIRRDDRYLAFARFAMANPKNPWLPRIAAIEPVKFDSPRLGDNSYLVFMEKLQPAPRKDQLDLIYDLASLYKLHVVKSFSTWFRKEDWAFLADKSKDKGLAQFASFAVKNFNRLDLHRNNLMVRGKQLVFVDPVY